MKEYNADDEDQVNTRRANTKRERKAQLDDLRTVLSTRPGRNLIWRMLSQAGIYQTPFGPDDRISNYNMGRHNYGMWLLAEVIEVDSAAWISMQQEAQIDAKRGKQLTQGGSND